MMKAVQKSVKSQVGQKNLNKSLNKWMNESKKEQCFKKKILYYFSSFLYKDMLSWSQGLHNIVQWKQDRYKQGDQTSSG